MKIPQKKVLAYNKIRLLHLDLSKLYESIEFNESKSTYLFKFQQIFFNGNLK